MVSVLFGHLTRPGVAGPFSSGVAISRLTLKANIRRYGVARDRHSHETMEASTSHMLHRNMKKDPLVVESAKGCYLYLRGGTLNVSQTHVGF